MFDANRHDEHAVIRDSLPRTSHLTLTYSPVKPIIENFKNFLSPRMKKLGGCYSTFEKSINKDWVGLGSIKSLQYLWHYYSKIEYSLFIFFDTVTQTSHYIDLYLLAQDKLSVVFDIYIEIQHYLKERPTLLLLLMLSNVNMLTKVLPRSVVLAIDNILQQGILMNAQELDLYIKFLYGQQNNESDLLDYSRLPDFHACAWSRLPSHPFVAELNRYNNPKLLALNAWQKLWVLRHYTALFKAADKELSQESHTVLIRAEHIAWCLHFQLLYADENNHQTFSSLRLLARQAPAITTTTIDAKRNAFLHSMPCLFSAMFQGEMSLRKLEQEERLLEPNYKKQLAILQSKIACCIDCKKNPVTNDVIILPCKHNYYCDTCARKRADEQKPCLLCHGKIKKVKSIFGYKEPCQICNDQQADSVLKCLHCLCSICYTSVYHSASKRCPFCRGALMQEKELCRF